LYKGFTQYSEASFTIKLLIKENEKPYTVLNFKGSRFQRLRKSSNRNTNTQGLFWKNAIPLNNWEYGYNFHHLNLSLGIFIPEDLHSSIAHRISNQKQMEKINKKVLKWYFKTIEEE